MTLLDGLMAIYMVRATAAALPTAPHGDRSGLVFQGSARAASSLPAGGTPAPALP